MARDRRIEAAVSHFLPRFITNGVPLADFQDATEGLERWEDWCGSWSARAEIHEALGREALEAGNGRTAAQLLDTAALLYHFAKFMFVHFPDEMKATHAKAVECRRLALPHLSPPGERVVIPFEGKNLYGNLRKPYGVKNPPVVIMAPGLEATKEEIISFEPDFLSRGIATLPLDGPGQGESEYDLPIRGNYETVATAVVDWLEARGDIDPDRIAMWGISLGGYYAPRACAFETRLKACIAISGAYHWAENWDDKPELNKEAFRVRAHKATPEEARAHGETLSLKGVAKNIACPIYIVAGALDRILMYDAAHRLQQEVSGPSTLVVVEDGNHCCHNRPYKFRPQSADWMAQQLGTSDYRAPGT